MTFDVIEFGVVAGLLLVQTQTSLRADGSRERAPDDRLREAIHRTAYAEGWIASSLQRKIALQFCRELLAMTAGQICR
ncbi:hypothetical protein [Bradyrhizobium acaciae]|uniref:hypothetical protein n=1 Tax=Bradyrhizobium acaciae TaxID=2683706 RepID=UPI001E580C09|nr:hypothetical protein [Bradyrhizobium acaciae]MCC8984644.1 hypothetical protein [Bradyrhizobium acaciae]